MAVFGELPHAHSPIADHVEFAWRVSVRPEGPPAAPAHIPADGRVEVVWSDRGLIAGGHVTRPIITTPGWPAEVLGVQFKVGRAAALLGTAGDELVAEPRALADIWGSEGDLLAERIHEAPDPQAKVDTLLAGLEAHARADVRADPIVDHVAAKAADPASRIATVAEEVGYSERQLRRRFTEAVGFGPKVLQRIERFQRFVALTRSPQGPPDVARAAFDLGYADESHLARDARELAGHSPGAMVAAGSYGRRAQLSVSSKTD